MRVAILCTKETPRARYLLECFNRGVLSQGDRTLWITDYKHYLPLIKQCDVGVQICTANKYHRNTTIGKFRVHVNDHMKRLKKRIVTIDSGFLKNQSDVELDIQQNGSPRGSFDVMNRNTFPAYDNCIYYGVGFDGIKRKADYCNNKVTGDRWEKLKVSLKPWRKNGSHILIVGQTLRGLSTQHLNVYHWYNETVKELRKWTDRPIVFRHHPRVLRTGRGKRPAKLAEEEAALEKFLSSVRNFHRSDKIRLEDDLKDCWACVCLTSNASVKAAVLGIPVFVTDKACMAYDVASKDLSSIEKPDFPDRRLWCHRLAYSQWTAEEMRNGECWKRLRKHACKMPRK